MKYQIIDNNGKSFTLSDEHEKEIAELKETVANRDTQINSLKEQIAAYPIEISLLKKTITERNNRIKQFEDKVSSLDHTISEKNEQLDGKDSLSLLPPAPEL